MVDVRDLLGKTLQSVKRQDDDEILFVVDWDERYLMYHQQDCCESVTIDDIVGDLNDLVGSPITLAEEVISDRDDSKDYGSETWTFYKFATVKGYVTIKWFGESNGYYSESVDFKRLK